jgi:hypothetical protein
MVNPFGDFDFSLLDNPEFGEDAVREELVAPLLRALGYSASPPYQIIRSRKLEHPFVYFGTVKKDITIIPDYVLERDGRPAWIGATRGDRHRQERRAGLFICDAPRRAGDVLRAL